MKKSLFLLPAVLALAAGCGDQSGKSPQQQSSTNSGGSVITAPVDYLGAISKQQQNAVKKIDTVVITQAIQLFQVQEGRNPKDLNELVEKKYLAKIPETPHGTKLEYDATAGTVKVVNQ